MLALALSPDWQWGGSDDREDNLGEYVALKFDSALDDEMLRLATQYVKVSGTGRFNKHGDWTTVTVDDIRDTRSWDKPFDLSSLIEESSSTVFDPEAVVTTEDNPSMWRTSSTPSTEHAM